jgi:Zn-dependent M28 family amino/carboxypeptidase
MTSPHRVRLKLSLSLLLALALLAGTLTGCANTAKRFSGKAALKHVQAQMAFGPRPVGSEANRRTGDYIMRTLEANGWRTEAQEFAWLGLKVRNIIGRKGKGPTIILGAHYDTRPVADSDPSDRTIPVPGANDGGSGTAVLLELSRVLDKSVTDRAEIMLAFFDAEDRGGLNGWQWCVGSRYLAANLDVRPQYVLVVDMIGDDDQRIYYEWTSTLWLQEKVWRVAADLGYQQHFIAQHRHSILDDHSSFQQWSIPAALIIDFDYPYWHTRYDTLDKISADSLQRVGDVLETMLEKEPFANPTEGPGSPVKR